MRYYHFGLSDKSSSLYPSLFIAIVVTLTLASHATHAQSLNLLFYGNSYTTGFGSTRSVPDLVRDLAIAEGKPAPFVKDASFGGARLNEHAFNNTAVISNTLPQGQTWDRVIMQEQSTYATSALGNVTAHRNGFKSLFAAVRTHSPNVKAIGYETWSRAPSDSLFAGVNPLYPGGPSQMQADIRSGYALSTNDVNMLYGLGTSIVAPVGSAWERANWQNLHISDRSHAQNRGTLLAAIVIYAAIYSDPAVADLNIGPVLATLMMPPEDGAFLLNAAQQVITQPTIQPTDIVWQNINSGQVLGWRTDTTPSDGFFITSSFVLPTLNNARWQLASKGDFNLDGSIDLLWRNRVTGDNAIWFMNGSIFLRSANLPRVADNNWEIRATADMNSDGLLDIIWRNRATGANVAWIMNQGFATPTSATALPAVSDLYWQIEAVADFNADTKPDLLWRNGRTGATATWFMNGTSFISSSDLSATQTNVNLRVASVADFNADAKPDILWRNTLTGANELWLMNGVTRTTQVILPTVADTFWRVCGQSSFKAGPGGDFNGDSNTDLFWRRNGGEAPNGQNAVWLMNGPAFGTLVPQNTIADTRWDVAAIADLTRDNKPDVLWRNSESGQNVLWVMDGLVRTASIDLPATTATFDWIGDVDGDESSDIVWQRDGNTVVWLLDGTPTDGSIVRATREYAPQDIPVGDVPNPFYGLTTRATQITYFDSILNQQMSTIEFREMQGLSQVSTSRLEPFAAANLETWNTASFADFNRDGTLDVLWRNSISGSNTLWLLSGTTNTGTTLGSVVPLPNVADVAWGIK